MDQDQEFYDGHFHEDAEVMPLIEKFADYSAARLNGIITKYISYEPAAVRAALYLSVQKGLISRDLKQQLLQQIESNFKKHINHIRAYDWEKNNSFVKYVSAYSDDQIYEIIERPGDIVIDVYFAVLTVARERELISSEDFDIYCRDAKSGVHDEHFPDFGSADESPFSAAAQFTETAEHAGESINPVDISEAGQKRKGLIWPGFSLLLIGIFVAFFKYNRTYHGSFAQHTRFLDVGFGIFIAAAGLVLLSLGIWLHFKKGRD